MQLALSLARRGYGSTSPNPMVGAVLVKGGKIIGRGWHRRAGEPHAEIEALRDAAKRGHSAKRATLFVTLEPCCTHGRTPPCTEAIIAAGIRRVVIGARDPNPKHSGKGFGILRRAGVDVVHGVIAEECTQLNESFDHWIEHRTPFVTVKAAMTLDGKIAAANGESKWITGEAARRHGMKLRQGSDAILVGVNTVLADDPSLTYRPQDTKGGKPKAHPLRRIVLDPMARTPLTAKVVSDAYAILTTIVVSKLAPKARVAALSKRVEVQVAPLAKRPGGKAASRPLDLRRVVAELGAQNITSLLVEGGGETNASFLFNGLARRVAFFYAPRILGGRSSRAGVAGDGAASLEEVLNLSHLEWRRLGPDLLLTARVEPRRQQPRKSRAGVRS
jgi:diaminohydroxyphosphoribosylaminopyrimidine deaminase/5-amino-6-(5-phosphoribosylamino)uracil reductase